MKAIDFVRMVENAYYCKNTYNTEENENLTVKLLMDGYYGFNNWGNQMTYQTGKGSEKTMVIFTQSIIVYTLCIDGYIKNIEYNIYSKWCRKLGYIPKSVDDVVEYRKKYSNDEFEKNICIAVKLRDKMDSTFYYNFVYGLVLMCVLSEGKFTENAYNYMRVFLKPGFDNFPSYYSLMNQIYI